MVSPPIAAMLTTVLAAADNGVAVRVAADACAGSSPENHQMALSTMALFTPLVTVTDTDTILSKKHYKQAIFHGAY